MTTIFTKTIVKHVTMDTIEAIKDMGKVVKDDIRMNKSLWRILKELPDAGAPYVKIKISRTKCVAEYAPGIEEVLCILRLRD